MSTKAHSWRAALLSNPHVGLPDPEAGGVTTSFVVGDFLHFHYGCDGVDDRGWGCGYRTLQSMSSWLCFNSSQSHTKRFPPSIDEIQQALVTIGDKPPSFRGSREWIGTFEAAVVLDHLFDIPCRILHVRKVSEFGEVIEQVRQHFRTCGSPLMMGGDRDNSSKGILGVCTGTRGDYFLVLDPHYYGPPLDREGTQGQGWISWKRVSDLDHSSFYNLCLPQTARQFSLKMAQSADVN